MTRPHGLPVLMFFFLLSWVAGASHAAGRILLILDDMGHGYGRARLEPCFALPPEVAFSIIPGTAQAARTAARCTEQGRDYLAHLPWQPLRPEGQPERLLARLDCPPQRLDLILEQTRRELPALVGANNHQGSRACLDAAFLARFAQAWQPLGLPFVDSRTVAGSRVPAELGAAGIAVFENQLFLDHVDKRGAIAEKLAELEQLARRRELTIAIAHPRPNTLALLGPWAARLPAGLELVSASRALLSPPAQDWLAQGRTPWPGVPWPTPAGPAGHNEQEE